MSEAYFARLLGLSFVAVMPRTTSQQKIDLIEFHGGLAAARLVDDPASIYEEARTLAARANRHYLDQFTYAERVTDWRGNNNIARSRSSSRWHRSGAIPSWVVLGAGTGGVRHHRPLRPLQAARRSVCVVDPEGSVYLDSWSGSAATGEGAARVPDRGGDRRPRVEPSFVGTVVDAMIRVPDAASVATMRWTSRLLGDPSVGRRAPPCGARWA